jgi:hypothetical protein
MARLPVTFAIEAPPRRRWMSARVFAWTLLFAAFAVWIGAALMR